MEQQDHEAGAGPDARVGEADRPAPIPVVTVTFSPGRHLEEFLDSAERQSYPVEVTMVDNGSRDGSVEQAARAGRARLVRSGGNLGYGRAMNLGVWRTEGEFVLLANPDVVLGSECVAELLACAARHPRAGAVGPRILDPTGKTYPSARAVPTLAVGIGHALLGRIAPGNRWTRAYREGGAGDMRHETAVGWLSGSVLLVRRAAFEEIGGFDERYFMYMEDVDLGDRLARAGWQNIFCPRAQVVHDQGHAANRDRARTLRAHHESVYRFLADRYSSWWQAPLRVVLRAGLAARLGCALAENAWRRSRGR